MFRLEGADQADLPGVLGFLAHGGKDHSNRLDRLTSIRIYEQVREWGFGDGYHGRTTTAETEFFGDPSIIRSEYVRYINVSLS